MPTTIAQIRKKVREVAEARKVLWTAYPLLIEYDNLKVVNFESQKNPFLKLSLKPLDGMQADLALKPIHRVMGTLIIEAWDKVGAGNVKMDELLTFFYPTFNMTDIHSPLRTYAARLAERNPKDNWTATAAIIPVWWDSFPT